MSIIAGPALSLGWASFMDPITGGWSLLSNGGSDWSLDGVSFIEEKLLSSEAFFNLEVQADFEISSSYILSVSNLSPCTLAR